MQYGGLSAWVLIILVTYSLVWGRGVVWYGMNDVRDIECFPSHTSYTCTDGNYGASHSSCSRMQPLGKVGNCVPESLQGSLTEYALRAV
jgi:hypothetical protein